MECSDENSMLKQELSNLKNTLRYLGDVTIHGTSLKLPTHQDDKAKIISLHERLLDAETEITKLKDLLGKANALSAIRFNRIKELDVYISDAFEAHPNLDMDVERVRKNK